MKKGRDHRREDITASPQLNPPFLSLRTPSSTPPPPYPLPPPPDLRWDGRNRKVMSAELGTSGGGDKAHYKSYKFVTSAPPPPSPPVFSQVMPSPHCACADPQCADRKKYRKLRFKFDQSMKRSDELFKQDQAAIAGVRRIAEENTFALQSIYLPCLSLAPPPPSRAEGLTCAPIHPQSSPGPPGRPE